MPLPRENGLPCPEGHLASQAGVMGQEPILHGGKQQCNNEAVSSPTAPVMEGLLDGKQDCTLDQFLPNRKRPGEDRGVQLPQWQFLGH